MYDSRRSHTVERAIERVELAAPRELSEGFLGGIDSGVGAKLMRKLPPGLERINTHDVRGPRGPQQLNTHKTGGTETEHAHAASGDHAELLGKHDVRAHAHGEFERCARFRRQHQRR